MLQVILPEAIELALDELGADARNQRYKDDPVLWAKEVAGVELWSKQKEIVTSGARNRRTTVRASNGPGKSFSASVLAAWFIAMHDPRNTLVVISAPSFRQVKDTMFFELNARKMDIDARIEEGLVDPAYRLPGRINTSDTSATWKSDVGDPLAIGRKPADKDVIRTFQGLHRTNILFILDEAGGLDAEMFQAAERMTTNDNVHILAIGNPDRRASYFFQTFYDPVISKKWNQIHISAYDTPAITGEPCPPALRKDMPDQEWIDDQIAMFGGVDDPRVKVSVFGDFPDADDTVFFSETAITTADAHEIDPDLTKPKIMGVDLSMFGSDESVVYLNQDNRIRKLDSWGKLGTIAQGARIHQLATDNDVDYVNIDADGLGGPIISYIEDTYPDRRYTIAKMNGNSTPPDRRRWYNAKAWWYDRLREDMIMGRVDLDIPQNGVLRKQLSAIESHLAKGARAGALQIELKSEMRARVGFSPDEVDALVYAHMTPEELEQKDEPTKHTVYERPGEIITQLPDYLNMIDGIFDSGIW